MILLNTLKHHLPTIQHLIVSASEQRTDLRQELLKIGASQMDLYTGKLSEAAIATEVTTQLQALGYYDYTTYQNWIEEGRGYRGIRLSDQSDWVLRMGHELPLYVHLHPGRYSKHSIRVKAGALKMAIYLASQGIQDLSAVSTEQFNDYRLALGLSPVRSLKAVSALAPLLRLLC